MNRDAGAIAAIEARLCDDPEDDEAWLVYADHLGDIGDPHGELIVLSRAGTREPAGEARMIALERRLVAEGTAALEAAFMLGRRWEHGFLLGAWLRLDDSDDIVRLQRLLEAPHARLLRALELEVGPKIRAQDLAKLAQLPLGCLRELTIVEQPRGDVALRSLVGACTRLTAVDCRGAGLTHNGAIALAALASAGTLRRLHVQRNRIRGKGVALLAPELVGLELLDLRDNDIGRAGLVALAETPALASLRTLRLQLDTFGTDDLQVLADSTTLPRAIVRYVLGVLDQRRSKR